MSRAQETLARLVVASQVFSTQLNESGGQLRVGLYNTDLDVGDIPGKITALLDRLDDTPWLRDLYGFDPAVLRGLAEEADELRAAGFERTYSVDQEVTRAKLHMKAHLYITRPAWDPIMSSPAMEGLLRAHFEELAAANRALATGAGRDLQEYSDRLSPLAASVVQPVVEGASPSEVGSLALFLAVGSHNQNNRSLALDGEVAFVTAGWGTLNGLMDFITLTGLCEWVDDVDELESLFPGYDGFGRRLSRFMRIAVE